MVLLYNMELAGVLTKRDGGKNYSAIRNKLQLVRDVDGQNESEMQWRRRWGVKNRYLTSGYAPISARLIELLLKNGRLPAGENGTER